MSAAAAIGLSPERRKGLGSSQVGAIIGIHPYCTPLQIWHELTGRAPPFEGNFDTRMGQAMEPIIADEYATVYGVKLTKGESAQHPEIEWAWATPDYEKPNGELLEIKNCRFKAPKMIKDPENPGRLIRNRRDMRPVYEAQVRWQMWIRNAPAAEVFVHCMAGRNEERFELLRFERRADIEEEIVRICTNFWGFVIADAEPPSTFPR